MLVSSGFTVSASISHMKAPRESARPRGNRGATASERRHMNV